VDKLRVKELKAKCHLFIGDPEANLKEGSVLFTELHKRNPENHVYILGLLACESKFKGFWPSPCEGGSSSSTATAKSFPKNMLPDGGVPVAGWMSQTSWEFTGASASTSSSASGSAGAAGDKAVYRKVGSRMIKENKPALRPVRKLTNDEQKDLLQYVAELNEATADAQA